MRDHGQPPPEGTDLDVEIGNMNESANASGSLASANRLFARNEMEHLFRPGSARFSTSTSPASPTTVRLPTLLSLPALIGSRFTLSVLFRTNHSSFQVVLCVLCDNDAVIHTLFTNTCPTIYKPKISPIGILHVYKGPPSRWATRFNQKCVCPPFLLRVSLFLDARLWNCCPYRLGPSLRLSFSFVPFSLGSGRYPSSRSPNLAIIWLRQDNDHIRSKDCPHPVSRPMVPCKCPWRCASGCNGKM
jgi:hypothetical protein